MPQIYATLGPKCCTKETFTSMLHEGMDGMRLNLSHSSLEQSRALIHTYAETCRSLQKPIQLMIDLHGPEQRTGSMQESIELASDDSVIVSSSSYSSEKLFIPVSSQFLEALEPNDHILIQDGTILLRVEQELPFIPKSGEVREKLPKAFSCKAIQGGTVTSRQSVKIQDKEIYGPVLTEEDQHNLDLAVEMGITAVMQPFVRNGNDVFQLRNALESRHVNAMIFAKIESMSGVRNLDSIMKAADVIVVARGDLGNAMPLWELPAIQKEIAEKCRAAGKPFMVVTQMLHSMILSPIPTRAEVLDIFNAVLDGASYLMVTGETSIGHYPEQVIHYLRRTADEAEKYLLEHPRI